MAAVLLAMASCARAPVQPVESLSGGEDVSRFTLTELRGTRSGEQLDVRARFGDGARGLDVDLHFRVNPQAKLSGGSWMPVGGPAGGGVRERTSTFLGGQSGPPSLGGRFDLLAGDGSVRYRVTIPLQELKAPY